MIRSRIVGTGHFLPEKVWTNSDLEKMTDTSDEWIRQRTGIAQRHVAEPWMGTSDMGAPAAQRALEAAGVGPEEVDLILCCTMTPDHLLPATACIIQHKIGAKNAAAYDISAACTGFLCGLASADAFIRAGVFKTILVIGADLVTNRLNMKKRDTAVLFGDGAGAVVLRAENGENGIISTYIGADGADGELLIMPAGGSKLPITPEVAGGPECDIAMQGRDLFKRAVVLFAEAAEEGLRRAGIGVDEVDFFVPHQANVRIIEAAAKRVNMAPEKIVLNIEKVGNTTAATIPIALDQTVRAGKLWDGAVVLLAAFGSGLTWGSVALRW